MYSFKNASVIRDVQEADVRADMFPNLHGAGWCVHTHQAERHAPTIVHRQVYTCIQQKVRVRQICAPGPPATIRALGSPATICVPGLATTIFGIPFFNLHQKNACTHPMPHQPHSLNDDGGICSS